jgi:hypothetical protein
MTEQSKIPLPPEGKGKSLFERVEDLFGLDAFVPPPVPERVAEPPAKAVSRKGPSAAAQPRCFDEPVVPAEPAPPMADEPVAEVQPAPEPVVFSGPQQTIDRARLAEQGLILPDGKITALLEEFRIGPRAPAEGLGRSGCWFVRRCRARARPSAPPTSRSPSPPRRTARWCWSMPILPSPRSSRRSA